MEIKYELFSWTKSRTFDFNDLVNEESAIKMFCDWFCNVWGYARWVSGEWVERARDPWSFMPKRDFIKSGKEDFKEWYYEEKPVDYQFRKFRVDEIYNANPYGNICEVTRCIEKELQEHFYTLTFHQCGLLIDKLNKLTKDDWWWLREEYEEKGNFVNVVTNLLANKEK